MSDPFASSTSAADEQASASASPEALIMNLLEAEPGSMPSEMQAAGPDIPALREQLARLVSTGKSKEAIGVQLTHEQVKRLTDKDVEKYFKRYEAYVGAKTTENLIDSALTLFTKAASLFVPLKNIEALQKELKNDYIINNELSNLVGGLSFKYGKFLAPASVALITAKHIDYDTALSSQKRQDQHVASEATLEKSENLPE